MKKLVFLLVVLGLLFSCKIDQQESLFGTWMHSSIKTDSGNAVVVQEIYKFLQNGKVLHSGVIHDNATQLLNYYSSEGKMEFDNLIIKTEMFWNVNEICPSMVGQSHLSVYDYVLENQTLVLRDQVNGREYVFHKQ